MNNQELKVALNLKDKFAGKRHGEKIELLTVRDGLMVKIIKLRDEMAMKRHQERLKILMEDY